jgi:hypothetical protein
MSAIQNAQTEHFFAEPVGIPLLSHYSSLGIIYWCHFFYLYMVFNLKSGVSPMIRQLHGLFIQNNNTFFIVYIIYLVRFSLQTIHTTPNLFNQVDNF